MSRMSTANPAIQTMPRTVWPKEVNEMTMTEEVTEVEWDVAPSIYDWQKDQITELKEQLRIAELVKRLDLDHETNYYPELVISNRAVTAIYAPDYATARAIRKQLDMEDVVKYNTKSLIEYRGEVHGAPFRIAISRSAVCEAIITEETVYETVPDPDFEVPMIEIEKVITTTTYDCSAVEDEDGV